MTLIKPKTITLTISVFCKSCFKKFCSIYFLPSNEIHNTIKLYIMENSFSLNPNINKTTRIDIGGTDDGKTKTTKTNFLHNKKLMIGLVFFFLLTSILVIAYIFIFGPQKYLSPFSDATDITQDNKTKDVNDKTFENPINGVMFTESEAAKFKDQKPIAVMVNNYVVARPSAGLSKADIIYEVVAEAGITRLMPIFYSTIPEKVSSVRSARYYFVELASAYHAHYIHWGAAHVPDCQKKVPSTCPPVGGKVETIPEVDAYDRIVKLGLPNLDGGNYECDGADCAFSRDQKMLYNGVPREHTAFVRLPLIYDFAKKIRVQPEWHQFTQFNKWEFKDDAPESERGTIGLDTPITYNYWDTMEGFNVKWEYDKAKNDYIRYQGNVKQTDAIDNAELRAKDIIIRFTTEKPAGDKKAHLLQGIVGAGDALIFMDGRVIEAKWSRSTHEELDKYTDKEGNAIKFNRGQIWVQLVQTTNKVQYMLPSTTTTPSANPTTTPSTQN